MQTHVAFPRLRLPSFQLRKVAPTQCPHLGLAADPFGRHPRPSDEHRCYAHLGHERIDLGHQQRFCLASAHGRCPFLMVSPYAPRHGLFARARAGWRNVSLARPALTAAQLGHMVELTVGVARRALTLARRVIALVVRYTRALALLVVQTWQAVRPAPALATVTLGAAAPARVVVSAPAESVSIDETHMLAAVDDSVATG